MTVKVYDIDAAQTVEQVLEPLTMPRYLVAKSDYDTMREDRDRYLDSFGESILRIEALETALREMFKADDDYGCGFYGQSSWLDPYNRLRAMVTP